ncbi:ArsR/SmtB family transcription factor [Vibrio gallicus]|uniref:ArsR/SmtB family transcription factor n=1 Tax=Vibrio gallicus TaxID=190897 RepID=UPI0021C47483|nr:metalloregulator ArsR/SmtB family transcription factor [Vibrio gallicus]
MSECECVVSDLLSSDEGQLQLEADFARLSKALSHPARVRILKVLVDLDSCGGCLNSDLVGELGLAQSTVSEHLRILKEVGFVRGEPKPPKMCYRVIPETVAQYKKMLSALY